MALVLAILVALLAAPPVQAASPAAIAEALTADPVHVDRAADPSLSVAAAGRLRLRIAEKAIGRIKVAVLAPREVARRGGLANVANAIDRRLRAPGALIVTAGGSYHVVTSHPASDEAAEAVRAAVRGRRGLAGQLLSVVDRVAAVDPGPKADLERGDPGPPGPPGEQIDGLFDAIRLSMLLVAASVALPFLIVAVLLVLRVRRARARRADVLAAEGQRARDELLALGDAIRELDIDVSLPGADPKAREHYEQAIGLYDRANGLLSPVEEPSELGIAQARQALAEAMARMDAARRLLRGGT